MSYVGNTYVKLCDNPSRGRGVFSGKDFDVGDVIEILPVVPFNEETRDKIDKTYLTNYWFSWKLDDDPEEFGALCSGDGLFFNHSTYSNAHHLKNFENKTLTIIASRPIAKDEEVTLKYNTVWFPVEEEVEKDEYIPDELKNMDIGFDDFN